MNSLIFDEVTVVICSFFSHEKLSKLISTIDSKFKILIIDNAREFNIKNSFLITINQGVLNNKIKILLNFTS